MKNMSRIAASLVAASMALAPAAFAQQYVYPAKGQNPEQQKKDEGECGSWATQQSGFDPSKPPPAQPAPPPTTATGTTPGAGARGAARGAVAAEVVGGEADRGAVVARNRSRQANAAAGQQQQQAASQQQQQGQATWAKARAACLEGKWDPLESTCRHASLSIL